MRNDLGFESLLFFRSIFQNTCSINKVLKGYYFISISCYPQIDR